jgi:phage FluMu protein Com
MLQLSCSHCSNVLFRYQKDGPGILKRLYLDRIQDYSSTASKLVCPQCKEMLGVKIIYKKENRSAYRLFTGAIAKKIVKQ